jgi:hypothetical protein
MNAAGRLNCVLIYVNTLFRVVFIVKFLSVAPAGNQPRFLGRLAGGLALYRWYCSHYISGRSGEQYFGVGEKYELRDVTAHIM